MEEEKRRRDGQCYPPSPVSSVPLCFLVKQTAAPLAGDVSMFLLLLLLLFDTHAGGNLTLNPTSVSVLRDFMSTNKRGLAAYETKKKKGGRLEECVFIPGVWLRWFCLNCEEVRRRECDFISSLDCFERKANRETLETTGLSWAAIYLSPGFCSLECAFCVSFLLNCTSAFISATRSHAFCWVFLSVFFFSHKSQLFTPGSSLSYIWQAWVYGDDWWGSQTFLLDVDAELTVC